MPSLFLRGLSPVLELPSCREEKRKKKYQNPKPARTFQVRENFPQKRVQTHKHKTSDDV